MKTNFQEWLEKANQTKTTAEAPQGPNTNAHGQERPKKDVQATSAPAATEDTHETVERVLQALQASGVDPTPTYTAWLEIAFALCHEFGEAGRSYFHRASSRHPEYDAQECDRQYTNCLKSSGSGIGLGSFFHHLKSVGIPPSAWLPPFPEGPHLPPQASADWQSEHADFQSVLQEGASANSGRNAHHTTSAHGQNAHSSSAGFGGDAHSTSAAFGQNAHSPSSASVGQGSVSAEDLDALDTLEFPEEKAQRQLPSFPDAVFEQLPDLLQGVVAPADSKEERDILLLGALTVLSACLPNIWGYYRGMKVFSNLYLFVTAPPSAGKGRLPLLRNLVLPIHRELRKEVKLAKEQYEAELAEYNMAKKDGREKPVPPLEKMLFIPVNSSSTGVFQLLDQNDASGLLFETEGDTMSLVFKTEYGNYSDGFRKAFHHELISYYRRTDREHVEMEAPRISTLLSGTPGQVSVLIPSAENGLFSRFLFYHMDLEPVWLDVFAEVESDGLEQQYLQLGESFFGFVKAFKKPMKFSFTTEQKRRFNHFFGNTQNTYLSLQGKEYVATVRRLGLMAFRMAMVLTALRSMEDGKFGTERLCREDDFTAVLSMISVLVKHSSHVFYSLPQQRQKPHKSNLKELFLERLPAEFSRPDYLEAAAALKLNQRTAERYITDFVKAGVLHRNIRGKYTNLALQEVEEAQT